MLKAHSKAWYDRLAQLQSGYYYPWRSKVPPFNGEDIYLEIVQQHISTESDVLDIGCGHGEVALELAPHCRSFLAYDRVSSYIDMAQAAASEKGIHNLTFICADSSAEANGGQARIPANEDSFDLIISRRGPLHWIADARRVARNGALLIQLNPTSVETPPWNDELPGNLRLDCYPYGSMYEHVKERLAAAGLTFYSSWTFIRPEFFEDIEQLYKMISWGFAADEVPSLEEIHPTFLRIFDRYATPDGLAVPRGRFLWMSVVDD